MVEITRINRMYPWLKVVALAVLLIAIVLSSVMAMRGAGKGEAKTVALEHGGITEMVLEGEVKEVVGVQEAEEAAQDAEKERAQTLEGKKMVALTFDDGPMPETTEAILATLADKKAKATFFMLGIQVEKYPEVAQDVARAGHEIENHSLAHRVLTEMNQGELYDDIAKTSQIIYDATGVRVKYVRPPYGIFSTEMSEWLGEGLVTWNVDPDDWQNRDAGVVIERVMNAVTDGAVVLLHDIYGTTAEAVPELVERLRADGYELVTIEEMIKYRGGVPGDGEY